MHFRARKASFVEEPIYQAKKSGGVKRAKRVATAETCPVPVVMAVKAGRGRKWDYPGLLLIEMHKKCGSNPCILLDSYVEVFEFTQSQVDSMSSLFVNMRVGDVCLHWFWQGYNSLAAASCKKTKWPSNSILCSLISCTCISFVLLC